MNKPLIFSLALLLIIGFVSASPIPIVKIYPKGNVNNSDYWDGYDSYLDLPGVEYWYNHTLAANSTIYNLYNALWSSTYNATYHNLNSSQWIVSGDAITPRNVNEVFVSDRIGIGVNPTAGKLYIYYNSSINDAIYFNDVQNGIWRIGPGTGGTGQFGFYNGSATTLAIKNNGDIYQNGNLVSKWWYNQTYSGSTYNATYAGSVNNASYLSTYNVTYHNLNSSQWIVSGSDIYNRNSGNVGIGTSSPGEKLHISGGNLRIDDNYKLGLGTASDGTVTYDGSNVIFNMDVGTGHWIFNNQRVGIGTSSPSSKLHVRTATAGTFTPSTSGDEAVFENNGDAGISIITPDNSDSHIFLGSNSTPTYAYLRGNSNNSDPRIQIVVGGIATTYTTQGIGFGTLSPQTNSFEIYRPNGLFVLTPSAYAGSYRTSLYAASNAEPVLTFGNNAKNEIRAGTTAAGGYLDFYTNNAAAYSSASDGILTLQLKNTGDVYIPNGKLGIGVTTSNQKLTVAGAMNVSEYIIVKANTTATSTQPGTIYYDAGRGAFFGYNSTGRYRLTMT